MQISIKSIRVGRRVRHDLGDLAPLMESMRRHGQMNPIVLTRDLTLIAGHRRLEAARELGWYAIEAVRLDHLTDVDRLEMELEENTHRKDFTEDELREGRARLEQMRHPGFLRRMNLFFRRLFERLFGRRRRRR
jgi:ParB family chromosome partitioning protein